MTEASPEQEPGPEETAARGIPPQLLVRFLALVVFVATGFAILKWSPLAGYLNKDELLALFDRLRDTWWAPGALIAAYLILCPLGLPASPLMIVGGVVWGVAAGSVYNVTGIFLGGVATYYLGRLLGRDLILHLFGRRLRRVEKMVARRADFWSLTGLRFLPLPFALVNYCAAFVGIRPRLFLTSTGLGLALSVPIFTYFAHTMSQAATGDRSGIYLQLGVAVGLLLTLILAPRVVQARKRKLRHSDLVARRRARGL